MPTASAGHANMNWLFLAALAFSTWGAYGVTMHAGVSALNPAGADPNARYKAFLFVGVAYFITAVCAPLIVLWLNGASWSYPAKGVWLSLLAGVLGALGAFFVLTAMGSVRTRPWMIPVIMSVVFAGAPIVNAIIALVMHPPESGLGSIRWQFWAGILIAALGATLVTLYKPPPGKPHAARSAADAVAVAIESPVDRATEDAVP
jgi:hypothetical protein